MSFHVCVCVAPLLVHNKPLPVCAHIMSVRNLNYGEFPLMQCIALMSYRLTEKTERKKSVFGSDRISLRFCVVHATRMSHMPSVDMCGICVRQIFQIVFHRSTHAVGRIKREILFRSQIGVDGARLRSFHIHFRFN